MFLVSQPLFHSVTRSREIPNNFHLVLRSQHLHKYVLPKSLEDIYKKNIHILTEYNFYFIPQ